MRNWMFLAITLCLVGCGHTRLPYEPAPRAGMTWERAVSIVEQGFYEDYGPEKTSAVTVTEQFIALNDGTFSSGQSSAYAAPVLGGAMAVGSSQVTTKAIGQRLYYSSLSAPWVYKKKMRDHRYAVIIRTKEGATARRVFFRSEGRAEEFSDAIEYLRLADR